MKGGILKKKHCDPENDIASISWGDGRHHKTKNVDEFGKRNAQCTVTVAQQKKNERFKSPGGGSENARNRFKGQKPVGTGLEDL